MFSLIATDLASGADASPRRSGVPASAHVGPRGAGVGQPTASRVELDRKLKPKPKKRLKKKPTKKKPTKKKPTKKKAAKNKKKKKRKKAASGSGLQRKVMWLAFAAIAGIGLFLIVSSVRNGPRARARARDRQRMRRPATR